MSPTDRSPASSPSSSAPRLIFSAPAAWGLVDRPDGAGLTGVARDCLLPTPLTVMASAFRLRPSRVGRAKFLKPRVHCRRARRRRDKCRRRPSATSSASSWRRRRRAICCGSFWWCRHGASLSCTSAQPLALGVTTPHSHPLGAGFVVEARARFCFPGHGRLSTAVAGPAARNLPRRWRSA